MPDDFTLEADKTYTVAICGASKAVQEEGEVLRLPGRKRQSGGLSHFIFESLPA